MIVHNVEAWVKWSSFYFYFVFIQASLSLYFEKTFSACVISEKPSDVNSSAFVFTSITLCLSFLSGVFFLVFLCGFEGGWLSTGGLYTICPAAGCRLWLALKLVPRIKVIQPVLCLINKYCPSSKSSPRGYRNDLVETCWLSCVSDLFNGSLVGLLLQHLAHPTRLQYISDICEYGDLTLSGTGCMYKYCLISGILLRNCAKLSPRLAMRLT